MHYFEQNLYVFGGTFRQFPLPRDLRLKVLQMIHWFKDFGGETGQKNFKSFDLKKKNFLKVKIDI